MTDWISSLPLDIVWHDAIPERVSRRRFDGEAVSLQHRRALDKLCAEFRPASSARASVVSMGKGSVFRGVLGPIPGGYGKVDGAKDLVAMIGWEGADVEIGYIGEAVVLEATRLGLGTCWVAGTFDATAMMGLVELEPGERVHCVTPIGYPLDYKPPSERVVIRMVRARSRETLEVIAPGHENWPAWARSAADAVRLAPSGANKQPWRLSMEEDMLIVALHGGKTYWTRGYDCGIAMMHVGLGALAEGVSGRWTRLDAPYVAGFEPSS